MSNILIFLCIIIMIIVVATGTMNMYQGAAESKNAQYILINFGHAGPALHPTIQSLLRLYKPVYDWDMDWREQRVMNANIFNIGLDAALSDLSSITKHADDMREHFDNYLKGQSFKKYIEKINQYIHRPVQATIALSTTKTKADLVFPMMPVGNRATFGKKFQVTEQQCMETNVIYQLIDMIFKGDQWTMINSKEIDCFQRVGFRVECFASPFNARMEFFGSALAVDQPYGRLGDCFEIFHTIIEGRDLCWMDEIVIGAQDPIQLIVSPPSSYELSIRVFHCLREIFERQGHRHIWIHLGVMPGLYARLQDGDPSVKDLAWLVENTRVVDRYTNWAWSFIGHERKMLNESWMNYEFKN